jgi:hypothetical protein
MKGLTRFLLLPLPGGMALVADARGELLKHPAS